MTEKADESRAVKINKYKVRPKHRSEDAKYHFTVRVESIRTHCRGAGSVAGSTALFSTNDPVIQGTVVASAMMAFSYPTELKVVTKQRF
jgi:hypothetical protein